MSKLTVDQKLEMSLDEITAHERAKPKRGIKGTTKRGIRKACVTKPNDSFRTVTISVTVHF